MKSQLQQEVHSLHLEDDFLSRNHLAFFSFLNIFIVLSMVNNFVKNVIVNTKYV